MKNMIQLAYFLLITNVTVSQNTYKSSKTTEKYGRLVLKSSKKPITGAVYDSYPNGNKKSAATYTDGILDGSDKYWFENGNLASETIYVNGKLHGTQKKWNESGILIQEMNFENGNLEGVNKEWHSNGKLKKEENFTKNIKNGIQREWNFEGQIIYEDNYSNGLLNGECKDWYENGQLKGVATFENDEIIGLCEGWYEDGRIKYTFENGHEVLWYRNGKILSETYDNKDPEDSLIIKYYDESGNEIDEEDPQLIFESGSFPGGLEAMFYWIRENVVYPEYAREINATGTVYVQFVIENSGRVSNAKIKKSDSVHLNDEALRLVRTMPRWIADKLNSIEKRCMYVLPITFTLF